MELRVKLLQSNPSWDNNLSILKIIDERKALFVTLNSCEDDASKEMAEKAMEFSTKPATKLLLMTPRNAKKLMTKMENLKLDGDSVTPFDILLEQQASIIEVQKEQATSLLTVVPASLLGYIEKLSSGNLNLIKELKQDQLEAVCGADVHQYLTS